MSERVATCRVCATSFSVDHGVLPSCHSFENFAVEQLELSQHVPDWQCQAVHCEWHGVDESHIAAYRICSSCGHVFKTPDALIQRAVLLMRPDPLEFYSISPIASAITHCPLCAGKLIDPREIRSERRRFRVRRSRT